MLQMEPRIFLSLPIQFFLPLNTLNTLKFLGLCFSGFWALGLMTGRRRCLTGWWPLLLNVEW